MSSARARMGGSCSQPTAGSSCFGPDAHQSRLRVFQRLCRRRGGALARPGPSASAYGSELRVPPGRRVRARPELQARRGSHHRAGASHALPGTSGRRLPRRNRVRRGWHIRVPPSHHRTVRRQNGPLRHRLPRPFASCHKPRATGRGWDRRRAEVIRTLWRRPHRRRRGLGECLRVRSSRADPPGSRLGIASGWRHRGRSPRLCPGPAWRAELRLPCRPRIARLADTGNGQSARPARIGSASRSPARWRPGHGNRGERTDPRGPVRTPMHAPENRGRSTGSPRRGPHHVCFTGPSAS
jgi:hypothetical protein